jgi:hypothetical protein
LLDALFSYNVIRLRPHVSTDPRNMGMDDWGQNQYPLAMRK